MKKLKQEGGIRIAKGKNEPRINDAINASQVRLIDADGNQAGIVSLTEAISRSEQVGLDLVEIAAKAIPPVCKILDFGKYRYELQKQEKINKKKQHVVQLKEIRIRPNTGDHDLLTKLKKAQIFLESGAKLKVTVMFRGREMSRKEAGIDLLDRVTNILEDVGKIDKKASLEGRRMSMILSPR